MHLPRATLPTLPAAHLLVPPALLTATPSSPKCSAESGLTPISLLAKGSAASASWAAAAGTRLPPCCCSSAESRATARLRTLGLLSHSLQGQHMHAWRHGPRAHCAQGMLAHSSCQHESCPAALHPLTLPPHIPAPAAQRLMKARSSVAAATAQVGCQQLGMLLQAAQGLGPQGGILVTQPADDSSQQGWAVSCGAASGCCCGISCDWGQLCRRRQQAAAQVEHQAPGAAAHQARQGQQLREAQQQRRLQVGAAWGSQQRGKVQARIQLLSSQGCGCCRRCCVSCIRCAVAATATAAASPAAAAGRQLLDAAFQAAHNGHPRPAARLHHSRHQASRTGQHLQAGRRGGRAGRPAGRAGQACAGSEVLPLLCAAVPPSTHVHTTCKAERGSTHEQLPAQNCGRSTHLGLPQTAQPPTWACFLGSSTRPTSACSTWAAAAA